MACDKTKMVDETGSITPEEFEKLTKTEQVCHLFKLGKEILFRDEPNFTISLYSFAGFFVEIWYRSPGKQIERIEVVSPKQVVSKYDKEIEIDEMF